MLYLDGLLSLGLLALWVYSVVDVIGTPDSQCRNVPKVGWLLMVVLLVWIGSIAWFIAGRPRRESVAGTGFYAGARPNGFPEYERLGRSTAGDAAADAEFLRQCRERAEEQRRRYEANKRREQE